MSTKALLLFFAAMLIAAAVYFSGTLQSPILSVLLSVNNAWHTLTDSLSRTYEEHLDQQRTIRRLRSDLALYQTSHLISHQMATEFNALMRENNATFTYHPDVALVRTIAYADFGDMNKLWLRMKDFNASKKYGLVYNEKVAGIVTEREGRPLALFNGDPKCTYAVFVGAGKSPGIVRGLNRDTMIVEYIPTWLPVAVGDEVITSGLDTLFFHGVKVGQVLRVERTHGYQAATIRPYFQGHDPDYFHVIRQVR